MISVLFLAVCADAGNVKRNHGCRPCHADFGGKLGEKHPVVKADSIAACLVCHDKSGMKKQAYGKNPFSTRIHSVHVIARSGVDCKVCHEIKPGVRFSVRGSKKSIGKPAAEDVELCTQVMASMAASKFLASGHNDKQVSCSGCHGPAFPVIGDSVENDRCLACHKSYDSLAEITKPKAPHDPNPHMSHLGAIACTACHYGHQKSVLYCKDCHPKFTLRIPFGE